MTANMETLEAAVYSLIGDLGRYNSNENEAALLAAFAAYCEQVAALQAENARLRSRLRESGVNELEARQQKTPPPTEK